MKYHALHRSLDQRQRQVIADLAKSREKAIRDMQTAYHRYNMKIAQIKKTREEEAKYY